MKVLIASSSVLAIPLFEVLSSSLEYEVCGLLTNQDKPTGRGQKIEPNDLATWAQNKKLPVYKSSNDQEIVSALTQSSSELVITIAFGQLVKPNALNIPKHGWINIHFSMLPKWRGAAPVQHSILSGEKSVGISIFKLDHGMDTGPIFLAKDFPISESETSTQVLERLSVEGANMALATLQLIKEIKQPKAQSNEGISIAPKFLKKDGEINWNKSAESIRNLFRALGSNPGVWTILSEARLRIDDLSKIAVPQKLQPGEIRIEDEKMYVGTLDGVIEILKITPAGRNPMSAAEFIRGLTSKEGLNFG